MRYLFSKTETLKTQRPINMASAIPSKLVEIRNENIKKCMGDFNTIPQYMIPRQMFYAGGSLDLATLTSSMWTDADSSENGDAIVLRRATKDLLYAFVNSNAMNAEVIGYNPPVWHSYLQYFNIGLIALVVVWGVLAFVRRFTYNKKQRAKFEKP